MSAGKAPSEMVENTVSVIDIATVRHNTYGAEVKGRIGTIIFDSIPGMVALPTAYALTNPQDSNPVAAYVYPASGFTGSGTNISTCTSIDTAWWYHTQNDYMYTASTVRLGVYFSSDFKTLYLCAQVYAFYSTTSVTGPSTIQAYC